MVSANGEYGFGSLAGSGGVHRHNGNKAKINMMITDTVGATTVLKVTVFVRRAERLQLLSYSNQDLVDVKVSSLFESRCFLTWSHTNRAVQPKKMARSLKFRIWKVEGLY